jgi:SET domain-containing protein 6
MRSIKPIARGEEIFNDYGPLPRSDLLRRYGYITENYGPYDVTEMSTQDLLSVFCSSEGLVALGRQLKPLSQEELDSRVSHIFTHCCRLSRDSLSHLHTLTPWLIFAESPCLTLMGPLETDSSQVELAEREGILEDSYDVSHPGLEGHSIPDELLALLYLILLDDQSLKALYDFEALPGRSKLATELVGEVLVILLQQREKDYATTLEEDEALLQAGNLSRRIAMAVKVRHGEKTILRAAIKEARTFAGSNKRMRLEGKNDSPGESGKRRRFIEEAARPKKKERFR